MLSAPATSTGGSPAGPTPLPLQLLLLARRCAPPVLARPSCAACSARLPLLLLAVSLLLNRLLLLLLPRARNTVVTVALAAAAAARAPARPRLIRASTLLLRRMPAPSVLPLLLRRCRCCRRPASPGSSTACPSSPAAVHAMQHGSSASTPKAKDDDTKGQPGACVGQEQREWVAHWRACARGQ